MRSAEEYAAMAERNMGRDDNGTAQVYASLAVAAAILPGMQEAIRSAMKAEMEEVKRQMMQEVFGVSIPRPASGDLEIHDAGIDIEDVGPGM